MTLVIDFHTHVVPFKLPDPVGSERLWPSIKHVGKDTAHVMIAGSVFREIDSRCWDKNRRLADMDADGVDIQVLSPMPELLSHWFSPKAGSAMARAVNDMILEMVEDQPDRFVGLGMVPVQDPVLAAEMLEECAAAGLAGVEIGTHIDGLPLGSAALDPFYAAAARLGMIVLVHPLRPVGAERIAGPADIGAIVAFPLETAFAAASIIVNRVAQRHPGLKILLSHGGGALVGILPRMDHGWLSGMSLAGLLDRRPSDAARDLWFDTIVYGTAELAHLVRAVGSGRIVLGSDYPFSIMQTEAPAFVRAAIGVEMVDQIHSTNALALLGRSDAAAPVVEFD